LLDHFGEFEAAVEAVFVCGEIARRMFLAAGAAGSGHGGLDVAEPGVDPFEFGLGRPAAACDSRTVFHACLGHGGKAGQAIAGDARAMLDILSSVGPDRLAGKTGNAPQLRIDGLVLTGLDGDDERDLVCSPAPTFAWLFPAQTGIVELNFAFVFVPLVPSAHGLHELLFDQPGGVPFDAELAGEFECGYVVFVVFALCKEVNGEEPFDPAASLICGRSSLTSHRPLLSRLVCAYMAMAWLILEGMSG
jgi:hypothetical protein